MNRNRSVIWDSPDLVRKRAIFLKAIKEHRDENACSFYMDETWVHTEMTQRRDWIDHRNLKGWSWIKGYNTSDTDVPAAQRKGLTAGPRAASSRGKRAIVIGAITESGPLLSSMDVFVSGAHTDDGDYHKDMNSAEFEDWLESNVNDMKVKAHVRSSTFMPRNIGPRR